MISTTTRIRVKKILQRIENNQSVTLEERIFIHKLSNVSNVVCHWLTAALGPEAMSIDND